MENVPCVWVLSDSGLVNAALVFNNSRRLIKQQMWNETRPLMILSWVAWYLRRWTDLYWPLITCADPHTCPSSCISKSWTPQMTTRRRSPESMRRNAVSCYYYYYLYYYTNFSTVCLHQLLNGGSTFVGIQTGNLLVTTQLLDVIRYAFLNLQFWIRNAY